MEQDNTFSVRRNGRVAVIHVGSRLGTTQMEEWGEALDSLCREQNGMIVVIDFKETEFISSRAIGVLLAARSEMIRRKGRMVLANIQPAIMRIFQLTRVDNLFEITDNYGRVAEAPERPKGST